MEETNQEPKYRINMKQTAKGEWYGEFTIRGDNSEELLKESEDLKRRVEEICRRENVNSKE